MEMHTFAKVIVGGTITSDKGNKGGNDASSLDMCWN